MAAYLDPPLVARNGRELEVLGICRISGINQDELSLDDQEGSYRAWLDENSTLPYKMTILSSQDSGESLDRAEYFQAIDLVESRQFDLVITEDLGRICRRIHAHIFCETCEDTDTRLIALNDHVDTSREDWRLNSFFAVMRHETYNKDTGKRIRRTLRNRFRQGGVFQCPIFGYLKAPEAIGEADVTKDPAAEPIYQEMFRRLENGASFAEIADWLNDKEIPTGPYCGSTRWTGTMVGRITRNPILKGLRVRNAQVSRRINKTGRRRSVKALPEERLERHCPHLAFIEPERYDRVLRQIAHRNANFRRKGTDGTDPRKNVPKKRTAWPGQHLRCGICGRIYHWCGSKGRKMLTCSGATSYRCWNGVVLDGDLAARKLTEAIYAEVQALPAFDDCLHASFRRAAESASETQAIGRQELAARQVNLARRIKNVTEEIAEMGGSPSLRVKMRELDVEAEVINLEQDDMIRAPRTEVKLPSVEEIQRVAATAFANFAATDPEVGRLLHHLIPTLKVYPYRLCDGGPIVLRAQFTLNVAALVPGLPLNGAVEGVLSRKMTVDLFDPPQRVVFRERVMALRAAGLAERLVAQKLGITQTATQRSAALNRLLQERGLTDPYLPVHEPPDELKKLRRHKHRRYRFEPLSQGEE